jgi:hypothetical protein
MLTAYFAMALALQAAPAPAPAPAPAADDPYAAVGRGWVDCVKRRVDAALRSDRAPDAITEAAFAGCARQENALRADIAERMGARVAEANIARVRSGTLAMMRVYIPRERGQGTGQGQ